MNPVVALTSQNRSKYTTGRWLFPAVLAATLLQNFYDLTAILDGANLALYTYEGPIFYKLGKDLIYVGILIGVSAHALKVQRWPVSDFATAIFAVIGVLWIISALVNGPIIATLGLRWSLPFLIFFVIGDWVDALDTNGASAWLLAGIVVSFAAQCYQLFNMPPVFGEVLPGIPARTPGIFVAPNSAAFFACACAACVMSLRPRALGLIWTAAGLAVATSLLAQSGTGIITSAVLVLRLLSARRPVLFALLAMILGAALFQNLDAITNRDDYVALSGGDRLSVLQSIATTASLSVDNFGAFTNAANLQSSNPEDQVAVDSLIASWIGNFGVLALPILLLTICFIKFKMRKMDWSRAVPSAMVFLLFAPTTIVFEAFPMNIVLVVGIWGARRKSFR